MKNNSLSGSALKRERGVIVPSLFVGGMCLALIGYGIFSSAEAHSPRQAKGTNKQLTGRAFGPTPTPCAVLAYVSNIGSNNISVIDTLSNTVVATVQTLGTSPGGVAVNPAGTRVYVTNGFGNNSSVSVIDTSHNWVFAVISDGIGSDPEGVAITPDGTRAYVANYGNGASAVSVIDTSSNTVVATAQGLFYPYGVAVKPDGTRVYVTNSNSNTVSIIDTSTNTVVANVPVPGFPGGIAVTPDGTHAYVTTRNSSNNHVSAIDTSTNTVVATIWVDSAPNGVAINRAGTRAYVTLESNTVAVIDPSINRILTTVPVGSSPQGVSVTPDGSRVYVANYFSNTVSVIDASSNIVIATVPVGMYPNAFGNFVAAVPCPSPTPTPTPTPTPHPCQLRVLIVYADSLVPAELQWEIQSQPNVAVVDLFDARNVTPTLVQLHEYDIVVPFSDYGFQDTDTLGNNLADYVDTGGVVVQYGHSHRGPYHNSQGIFGRWVRGSYNPYYYSNPPFFYMPFTIGQVNAAHPLMAGVTRLSSDSGIVAPPLGSTEVARDNNGNSLVAFREVTDGHTTVGVTGYVGDLAFASGDWGKVVVNAGNWLYNCEPGATPTPTPLPTCTPGAWQSVSSMPLDLYGAAGASDSAYFYAAGGYAWIPDGGAKNTLYRWSPNPAPNGSWVTLAPMPQPAALAMAVYYPPANKIYVFGGLDPDSCDDYDVTRIYDIASNTWSIGAPMPDVRATSAAGYIPVTGRIYIIGGTYTCQINTVGQNTWAYDPVADSWTDLTASAPLPHPADGFAYGVINNKLYLAGGAGAGKPVNLTWEYDPVANTYTQKADEPSSFQNNVPGSAVASGRLWVFGGGNPFAGAGAGSDSALPPTKPRSGVAKSAFPSALLKNVNREVLPTTADGGRYYDPGSDTWTSAPSLVVARSFPSSGAIGDNLLVAAGGYNGTRSVATVQKETVCIGIPTLQSAVSRQTHGVAGAFDIALPLTGTPGIECRTTGGTNDYTMVVTFSGNVTVNGNPQAQVTSGTGCVGTGGTCTGSVSISGNIVTVPLTNIANGQTINLRINGVNGSTSIVIPMSILIGDTNDNGTVNASDVAQTKSRSGQPVAAATFRSDVNANGAINAADVSLVKSLAGTGLP